MKINVQTTGLWVMAAESDENPNFKAALKDIAIRNVISDIAMETYQESIPN